MLQTETKRFILKPDQRPMVQCRHASCNRIKLTDLQFRAHATMSEMPGSQNL